MKEDQYAPESKGGMNRMYKGLVGCGDECNTRIVM